MNAAMAWGSAIDIMYIYELKSSKKVLNFRASGFEDVFIYCIII